jgi:hypothetical protein
MLKPNWTRVQEDKYWGPLSFLPRICQTKLTSLVFAWCVIERYGFENLPWMVRCQWSTYKEPENGPDWEPVTPTLNSGLGTDWNSDWCRTGLWTTTRRDISHPRLVSNNSKASGRGAVSRVAPQPYFLWKIHQNVFFWHHVRSLKRFETRFCRNRHFYKTDP